MTDSNAKGNRRERELVNKLDGNGFEAMRAPASGAATLRELPDVVAGNGDVAYAFEAKSSSGDPIYLDGEEIEDLSKFARCFGLKPRIAVRYDREPWYCLPPRMAHMTDAGSYRVKLERAEMVGATLNELEDDPTWRPSSDVETSGESDGG